MTTEAALRARILAAIRQKWPRRTGVLLFGRPASAATGAGHPDLSGVVRARPIALEIKKARAKPTPKQIARIQDLRDAGCYAWVVRSPYEACDAVYWTAKGWTRPLSNEPLDLGDWLMGDPAKAPAPEFTPAAESAPPTSFDPVLPEPEPASQDLGYKIPPEVWDTPEHQEAAARVLGYESAEQRRQVLNGDVGAPEDHDLFVETVNKLNQLVQKFDADLRTVGDRVTLVYERVDQFLAVLAGVDAKLIKLLALVEEDPGEDYNEASNGAEPTPVPEPERPKRTRRRKSEMQAEQAEAQGALPEFPL